MNKLRLVTVTGSRTTTLYHMLKHYAHLVDEMCVVVYEWEGSSTYDEVSKIINQFGNAKIVYREIAEKFNWEKVTELYNKIKSYVKVVRNIKLDGKDAGENNFQNILKYQKNSVTLSWESVLKEKLSNFSSSILK